MNPEYMMTKDGQVIPLPSVTPPVSEEPVERVEPVTEPTPEPEPEEEDELAGLFEVPQPDDNDMRIDHLFAQPEGEEDFSDLVEVSREDIMGDGVGEDYPGTPPSTELPQRRSVKRFKRTSRRYQPPPPPSVQGLRG